MRISFSFKITGLVLACTLAMAAAISITTYYFVTTSFRSQALSELQAREEMVKAFLERSQKDIAAQGALIRANQFLPMHIMANNSIQLEDLGKSILETTHLDFFTVTDRQGSVIARGHTDDFGDSIADQVGVQKALAGEEFVGVEEGKAVQLALRGAFPVDMKGQPVGVLIIGIKLSSQAFVAAMKKELGVEVAILDAEKVLASTFPEGAAFAIGEPLRDEAIREQTLERGERRVDVVAFGDNVVCDAAFWPVINARGEAAGMFMVARDRDVASAAQRKILGSVLFITLLVGLVIAAAGVLLGRSISKPVTACVAFANKVAAGELNEKLLIRRNDELGMLAKALTSMVDTLREKIGLADAKGAEAAEEASNARQAMARADEARREAESAEREGRLGAARMLEELTEGMARSSRELEKRVESSRDDAVGQKRLASDTATSMEQMNATVLEVARNASSAAQNADNASEKSREGHEVVSRAVSAIERVKQENDELNESMTRLAVQVEDIGRVMGVISDIADQTNLLALNAAIEAARAGEAGRGFAVVADEVRKLAEKTMSATKEVGQAIEAIQQGSRENRARMEDAVKSVDEATELADRSGAALQEIMSLSRESADQIRAIAAASEEQSAASEHVSETITQMDDMSGGTAQSMERAAEALSELKGLAERLDAMVADLKKQ